MDFKLQEITLPAFVWYILPGLNFVLAVVAVPILLLKPSLLLQVGSLGGVVFVVLVALVAGFVMDSLKLYALRSGHQDKKEVFFEKLASELGISGQHVATMMDAVRMGLPERGSLGRAVAFNHSRWVMMTHSAKCFYALAVIWAVIAIAMHAQSKVAWYQTTLGLAEGWPRILVDLLLVVAAAVIAYRTDKHAERQRKACDELYYAYARRYAPELRGELLGFGAGVGELDIEKFLSALQMTARLKAIKRKGWQEHGLMEAESVADHSFMVCLLAYLLAPYAGVNRSRSVALALMHDVPEAIVGDITPNDPQLPSKRDLEGKAARDLAGYFGEPDVFRLWHEVERGESAEARFVHELDILEPALQAAIYEEADCSRDLGEFYVSAREKISSDLGIRFLDSIVAARASSRQSRCT